MKTFRFLDFPVYQEAKLLYQSILQITDLLSHDHNALADQMKRSALSILLNIAEGSAKRSDKDFNRFLENALGSVNELVACLDVCLSQQIITSNEFHTLTERYESVAKQLGGLSRKLKNG